MVIPDENDSVSELERIAGFIAGVDKKIPWHVSGFYGAYKFQDHRHTPENILKRALEIGKSYGLRYVYAGNLSGYGNVTSCPGCQRIVIKRQGFTVTEYNLDGGVCLFCKTPLDGVF